MALTGTEVLQVLAVQANGQLAATTEQTTTQAIANLADQNGGVGLSFGGVSTVATTAVSTTTLANIAGLVATVPAGTYQFDAYLANVTNNNTGGVKLQVGGTAVSSTCVADTWVYNGTTVAGENNTTTSTSALFGAAVTATAITVNGTITIGTAGTVTIQAAQQVSNSTTLSIGAGSFLTLTRLL